MKAILLTTAAALIAAANPASAQILGGISGGGSGGILGGVSMPSMPSMPEPMRMPTRSVETVTRGSATGNASGSATKSVNPRTGKASTQGSAQGSGSGSLTQSLDTPLNSVTANGAGSGSAAGAAGTDAQLIGSDAVRGTLHQTRDKAGNTVTTYRDRSGSLVTATKDKTGNLISSTRSASGSAQGSAAGSASGMVSGLSHNLALDGSAAGDAAGTFDVKPGTQLYDLSGEKIGKVREVYADGSGRVKGLLVKSGDTTALLPASNFAASGNALVTTLSEAQIASAGQGQAGGNANGAASGIFSGLSHNLALSGSAAADAAGSLDLKPGSQLYDMTGEKIGKVKEVVADAKGRVTALVVKVKDTTATLPAADFAANGDVLVTAMSQAQIVATGDKQAGGAPATGQKASSVPAPQATNADAMPPRQSAKSSDAAQPATGSAPRHSPNTKGQVSSD